MPRVFVFLADDDFAQLLDREGQGLARLPPRFERGPDSGYYQIARITCEGRLRSEEERGPKMELGGRPQSLLLRLRLSLPARTVSRARVGRRRRRRRSRGQINLLSDRAQLYYACYVCAKLLHYQDPGNVYTNTQLTQVQGLASGREYSLCWIVFQTLLNAFST